MKRPNKKHREFIGSILKCDDQDILEHRMMRLPMVASADIYGSWTKFADFRFSNGKRFLAMWRGIDGMDELKECFKEMLAYTRKQRKGLS